MFKTYIRAELIIFTKLKKYFEKLPAIGNNDYENAFYDIVAQYEEEERDPGFLEAKIMEIEGKTLELIADVTYNNYDEQIKLRPKKIIKSEY